MSEKKKSKGAESPEETVIVCTSREPGAYIVPNSRDIACEECGTKIVIAPSAFAKFDAGAKAVCMACAKKMMDDSEERGEKPKWGILPGQMQEIYEGLHRN